MQFTKLCSVFTTRQLDNADLATQMALYVLLRLGSRPKHCYMRQCFHLPHSSAGRQFSLTHHTHCQQHRLLLFHSAGSSYLFSMSLTFWTSVPITVCMDLRMHWVSSFLLLSALVLGTAKRPVHQCFWPVDVPTKLAQENNLKKDRKFSAYIKLSNKKEHKQTQNHITIIQFSLLLRSKITFESGEIGLKHLEQWVKAREPEVIIAHAYPLLIGQL